MDSFILASIEAPPPTQVSNLVVGLTASLSIVLTNHGESELHSLRATIVEAPSNVQATLRFDNGAANPSLIPNQTQKLIVDLLASDASVSHGDVHLRIQSGEGIQTDFSLPIHVVPTVAILTSQLPEIVTGVTRGGQRVVDITVTNIGGAASSPLNVLMPDAPWIQFLRPSEPVVLAAGQSHTYQLQFAPTAELELGTYSASVIVVDGDNGLEIPLTARVLGDSLGALKIIVEDEYTFFTAEAPNLAGARVIITDLLTNSQVLTDITNSTGTIDAPSLVEGYYEIRVEAPQHHPYSSNIRVEAGLQKTLHAFLSRQTVTYRWDVEQQTITSRTQIDIDAIFETNVPAPVVVVYSRQGDDTEFRPGAILDFSDLVNVGDTEVVQIKIANYGLIQVENVNINIGDIPNFEVTPLVRSLAVLSAKSEVVVPAATRVSASNSSSNGISSSTQVEAAKPDFCYVDGAITWRFKCRDWIYYSTSIDSVALIGAQVRAVMVG